MGFPMHARHCDDRPAVAHSAPDALLRMRLAVEDATFVAEGIAMGLPLKWIERAPLSEDRPPLALAWRAPHGGARPPADR